MDIKELVKKSHKNAREKGFWKEYEISCYELNNALKNFSSRNIEECIFIKNAIISQSLLLIVSEITEAVEGLRKGDVDNFKEELADVAIRLADLCGGLDIDLEEEIKKKIDKNKNRPYKHGKAF